MSDRRKKLYPHQLAAMRMAGEGFVRARAAGRAPRIVIQAATGFGKTVVMAYMNDNAINNARMRGRSTCIGILVPRLQLIDQTVAQLEAHGIPEREIGVIHRDYRSKPMASIQITTPQTLGRRSVPPFDLVFIDECHEQHKIYRALMERPDFQSVPFIGLSATPWSKGMGTYWSDLIVPATTADLVERVNEAVGTTFLAKPRTFCPKSGMVPDLSGIACKYSPKTGAVDYAEEQLSQEMRKEPLVADAVATWGTAMAGGYPGVPEGLRPTVVFCVDIAHAKAVLEAFLKADIAAELIIGSTEVGDPKTADGTGNTRADIRIRFAKGITQVVVSVGVLTTGCDWPEISCIQLLRPTKSEMLLVQIVGRGLRPSPGKTDCLVLDHTSTTKRLGLVTDIHHAKLCDGKPKEASKERKPEEDLPKECPRCHIMKPPRTAVCPNCDHKVEIVSKVQTVKGELEEVKSAPKREPSRQEKQSWWNAFLYYCAMHGQGHKRATAYYRAWTASKGMLDKDGRPGVWPRGLAEDMYMLPGNGPTPEQTNWCRSQNIRWAKANQKRFTPTTYGEARP